MVLLSLSTLVISIHAPRVGSDKGRREAAPTQKGFQSTLPVWGATRRVGDAQALVGISIHAPRVGSDVLAEIPDLGRGPISIHAPRVGSDVEIAQSVIAIEAFQSTLPVWGATLRPGRGSRRRRISIHAPRVGSDVPFGDNCKSEFISIHAPRVGSDDKKADKMALTCEFQSTLPVWGATSCALRMSFSLHFNPRSPCGERPLHIVAAIALQQHLAFKAKPCGPV